MALDEGALGPVTWDEFIDLDEDDLRELIDGVLVEIEAPTRTHDFIVAMLATLLTSWALPRNAGFCVASGYKVRISQKRGVMPDVQFFRASNRDAYAEWHEKGLAEGRPDLAIEIVSPSSVRYDRKTKLEYYGSIAVPEYWIIDPKERTLEQLVYEPSIASGRYAVAGVATDDDVFCPQTYEGLEVPLAKLWTLPGAAD